MATVSINLPLNIGVAGTYLLYLYSDGTLLNSGGDALTESSNGFFSCTVAEAFAAILYRADVTKDGVRIYSGWLRPDISLVVDYPVTEESIYGFLNASQSLDVNVIGFNGIAVEGTAITTTNIAPTVRDAIGMAAADMDDQLDSILQDIPDAAMAAVRVVVPLSSIPVQIVRREDNRLLMRTHSSFSHTVEDVGALAGVEKVVFTVKRDRNSDPDADSLIQVVLSIPADGLNDGITYLNQEVATSEQRLLGSIAVQEYEDDDITKQRIVISIADTATALMPVDDDSYFDVKIIYSSDSDIVDEGEVEIRGTSSWLTS